LIQNGDVYTAAELPYKQIAESDDLYSFIIFGEDFLDVLERHG